MVTWVWPAATCSMGGCPTNDEPHAVPITFQMSAGTKQSAAVQGAHETTQLPCPSATVCTNVGGSGPRAAVVNVAAVEGVDCLLM